MTWNDYLERLATAGLLGTKKAPPLGDSPYQSLQKFNNKWTGQSSEAALLGIAAASHVFRRAGVIPETIPKPGPFAPEETQKPVTDCAAELLKAILNDHPPELLSEFLLLSAAVNQRIPPLFLPQLFGKAVADKLLPRLLIPVMGERGKWLAGQNPKWIGLWQPDQELEFQTGTRDQRLAYLCLERARDPAKARETVSSTWADDKPEDRAAFLETFFVGLSEADEPFLEMALEDKRKEVREVALEALIRLPNSALCQRMESRLRKLVKCTRTVLLKTRLSMEIPETLTPDMQRDGIESKSKVRGMGDKAYHLYRIVAATPLSVWGEIHDWLPGEWVEQISHNEWKEAVFFGLAEAAARQKNGAFGVAVLQHWLKDPKSWEDSNLRGFVETLVASLEPLDRESLLTTWIDQLMKSPQPSSHPFLIFLLLLSDHSWSKELTGKAIRFLFAMETGQKNGAQLSRGQWKQLGRYTHPQIEAEVRSFYESLDGPSKTVLEPFLSLIGFRQEMHKEFAS